MPRPMGEPTAAVGPVRVSSDANACILTVPAEIVATARIELGDEYMAEVVDGSLIYWPVEQGRPRGRFVGTGKDRHYVLRRGASIIAGPDPAPVRALMDWEF